jgi:serine/threonine-protein kinase RsbW
MKRGNLHTEVFMGRRSEARGAIGLRVPGVLAYRHLAIRLVSTACTMALDVDPTEDDHFEAELVSAFGEAFNNIALHAYVDGLLGPVEIDVAWNDVELRVSLLDWGKTFDPTAIAEPNLDALPEGGLGLFIIRNCVDVVDYRPGPPNVLRLVKRRRAGTSGVLRRERDAVAPGGPGVARGVEAGSPARPEVEAARQA